MNYRYYIDESCTICGTEYDLTNHHVVPQMVSKHLKTDKYDKTVRLCRDCHDTVEHLINELKIVLSLHVECDWNRNDSALAQFWLFKFGPVDVTRRFRTHYYHCQKILRDRDRRIQLTNYIEETKNEKYV